VSLPDWHEQFKDCPTLLAEKLAQSARSSKIKAIMENEQVAIFSELRAAGIDAVTLYGIANERHIAKIAIPILLKHFNGNYSFETKLQISIALNVSHASVAWKELVEAYKTTSSNALRNGEHANAERLLPNLAAALAKAAKAENVNELVSLASDPSNGGSRAFLLKGLKKLRSESARLALDEFAKFPEFKRASVFKDRK
jgi:hypothetical protein